MSQVHDFRKSLAKSHEYADAPWWDDVYRQAFPGMLGSRDLRQDGWHQRAGMDRSVELPGKVIYVDEKVRTKDWPDVLLEYWSNLDKRVPGWIAKHLGCDFIAYAFVPSRSCLLLPFLPLRSAWAANRKAWVKQFRIVDARNNGYTTRSVAVPKDVLRQAICDSMLITWAEQREAAA